MFHMQSSVGIPREAKFYDIVRLVLWLSGGIARKGNCTKGERP